LFVSTILFELNKIYYYITAIIRKIGRAVKVEGGASEITEKKNKELLDSENKAGL